MHDQPIPGRRDRGSSETAATQDLQDQAIVLIYVFTHLPAHLRLAELVREVTAGSADFKDVDRFQRAVSDLIGVGLLFKTAELILPTRAAIRFSEITEAGF